MSRAGLVRGLLLAAVAASLVEALFPFRLDLPVYARNRVERAGPHELRFGGHNVLRTPGPPGWLEEAIAHAALALRLEARPALASQSGPARILALSESPFRANLVVAQRGPDLVVRVRRPGSDPGGGPPFVVPEALGARRWVSIAVALEARTLRVAVDGREALAAPLPRGTLATWERSSRLALGDEPGGGRPWRGALRRASVEAGGRRHDLLAAGALERPEGSWLLPERLRKPVRLGRSELVAGALHGLGFLAIGALLALHLGGRRVVARCLALCALLSLAGFALKLGIAGRHPHGLDVAVQTLGGATGALLALRVGARRRAAAR